MMSLSALETPSYSRTKGWSRMSGKLSMIYKREAYLRFSNMGMGVPLINKRH